jgi:hypothetical protein
VLLRRAGCSEHLETARLDVYINRCISPDQTLSFHHQTHICNFNTNPINLSLKPLQVNELSNHKSKCLPTSQLVSRPSIAHCTLSTDIQLTFHSEHDGLTKEGKPDGRVGTGEFAHGQVDPHEAGAIGGSTTGGSSGESTGNSGGSAKGGQYYRLLGSLHQY